MALPWEELAAYAATVLPLGTNVYEGPQPILVPPAMVIRPDNPWREPQSFCNDLQHYVAVFVVSASSANPEADGQRKIYHMTSTLLKDLPEGWSFVSAGGMVVDESTGSQLLASALRLSFASNDLEEEGTS